MALGTLFAYSIFEYALSPPMSWMKESAEFLFGDEETRKKHSLINIQYKH